MKRYIKEYANDKIRKIKSNSLMGDGYKTQKIKAIWKTVGLSDRGFITIDETMKKLAEV